MSKRVEIAPSVLSADMARLADEVKAAELGGADRIHLDVMDGRFVPNITFGPVVVEAIRRVTELPLDVHLMIVEPERYIEAFAAAGSDVIGIHVEASVHAQRTLAEIRRLGKRACVVLNPHTPEDSLRYLMDDIDQVLVMTVNPGFGGQQFLPGVVPKIARLQQMVAEHGRDVDIAVDGGISEKTARSVVEAGANVLIAGAAVFGKADRKAAIAGIREAAHGTS